MGLCRWHRPVPLHDHLLPNPSSRKHLYLMTVIQEDHGRTNVYAIEPQINYTEPTMHNEKAELLNGRVAMMGIIAALGSYAVTGQIIPGLW